MKNSKKMSLDAFKEQAKNENVDLALESIQGGKLNDCHGFSGKLGKAGKWIGDNVEVGYDKDGWNVKIGGN